MANNLYKVGGKKGGGHLIMNINFQICSIRLGIL